MLFELCFANVSVNFKSKFIILSYNLFYICHKRSTVVHFELFIIRYSLKYLALDAMLLIMNRELKSNNYITQFCKKNKLVTLLPELIYTFLITGGKGSFGVNSTTGDVFIVGRQMFNVSQVYRLAISAQVVGTALNMSSTPTQVLNVQVGYRAPQFALTPYNVTIIENSAARWLTVFHYLSNY